MQHTLRAAGGVRHPVTQLRVRCLWARRGMQSGDTRGAAPLAPAAAGLTTVATLVAPVAYATRAANAAPTAAAGAGRRVGLNL